MEDAEEELFLLYSNLAGYTRSEDDVLQSIVLSDQKQGSGLGLIDQVHDHLTMQFRASEEKPNSPSKGKGKKQKEKEVKTLEISLAQDITGLRSRIGDTGGGVWRVSVLLAQTLLLQLSPPSNEGLFNPQYLKQANVLELGAGTGLLSLLLSRFVQSYTSTDLPELVPLIQKNVTLNRHVTAEGLSVEPLNWIDVQNCPANSRRRLFSHIWNHCPPSPENEERNFDLILAVDCVYNPSLVQPLLTTIDHFATTKTVTMIVMELRDEDVVREFLGQWLALPDWKVYRVEDEENKILDKRFVIWIGTKSITET